jgi:hypothetical protein
MKSENKSVPKNLKIAERVNTAGNVAKNTESKHQRKEEKKQQVCFCKPV